MMKIRGQRIIPPAERILTSVVKDDATGCWNWTKAVRSMAKPYGRLTVGSRADGSRKAMAAHRYSYEIFKGPIGDEMCVCHRCDNPKCCNPDHLFLGTKADNAADRDAKGRNSQIPRYRGERHPSSVLTDVQIEVIRRSSLSSGALAPLYGVTASYIRQLRRGEYRLPTPPEAA